MNIKVQLKDDLTRYHPLLTPGVVGYTTDRNPINDCFVYVQFYSIRTPQNILWKSLTIIDEEYLEEKRKKREMMIESLKENGNVELHWHHNGSFKKLSYQYRNKKNKRHFFCNCFSDLSAELYAEMRKAGIKVREFGVPQDAVAYRFNRDYYNDILNRREERWRAIVSTGEAVVEWNRNGGYERVDLTYIWKDEHKTETFLKREKGMKLLLELQNDNVSIYHIGDPQYRNKRMLGL
ncbi:hypothetical protein ACQCVB_17455 [Fictibacillus phosphorivorans]|uniref:hypothetical protein n=1 Tax=Fictibacillus phosphorivorans TaxID=1221500 RepID=UPI003CEB875D